MNKHLDPLASHRRRHTSSRWPHLHTDGRRHAAGSASHFQPVAPRHWIHVAEGRTPPRPQSLRSREVWATAYHREKESKRERRAQERERCEKIRLGGEREGAAKNISPSLVRLSSFFSEFFSKSRHPEYILGVGF